MSESKVCSGWVILRADREERARLFLGDDWDCAAHTWRTRDGRVFWCACLPNDSEGPSSDLGHGYCDTIEQAQAAADGVLRAAGYGFDEDMEPAPEPGVK